VHGLSLPGPEGAGLRGRNGLGGRVDHLHHQVVRIGFDPGRLFREFFHGIDVDQAGLQHGAAMRVRAGEHDLRALQMAPLAQLGTDAIGQALGEAQQIGGHDHGPTAVGGVQRQGLDPQVVQSAFGRPVAPAVSRQPQRLLRRDLGLGGAQLPRGGLLAVGRRKAQPQDQQDRENRLQHRIEQAHGVFPRRRTV